MPLLRRRVKRSFVHALVTTKPLGGGGRSLAWFASVLAFVILGALASGGVGNAATDVGNGASTTNAVMQKTSAAGQYGKEDAVRPPVVNRVGPTKTTVSVAVKKPVATSGTLPFTGLSLISTLALGGALVGIGIALRRRDSRE